MDSARMDFLLGHVLWKALSRYGFSRWLGKRRRTGRSDRLNQAILSKRLDYLARYANDAVALFDLDGKFVDVNDRFLSTYGYRRDEISRINANQLCPPHMRAGLPALQRKLAAQGGLVYETEHCAKDGRTIPVEISSRLFEVEGEKFVQAIIRDVSERREAEARILALSRLYAAISAASQAMVRAQNVQEVFDSVCRACVEYGGFRMAWVGLVDAERIVPHAFFGAGTEYLDGTAGQYLSAPAACEPQVVAYREGRVHICNDFIEDPIAAPWRERAAFYGFRASIALPLRRAGTIVGALTAYADMCSFFDDDVVALLEDLAGTISFGMDHFDRDERRRQAEAALRLNEARLLEAQAIGDIGDWVFDLSARTLKWSPQMYRLFERDPAQGPPSQDELHSYYDAETAAQLRCQFRRAVETGQRIEIEQRIRLASGREAHHVTVIVPVDNAAGEVTVLRGTIQDITGRKQAENERARLDRHMRELSQRLIAAQEDERRRLAAELHDRTSSNLAAIQVTLAAMRQSMPEDVLTAVGSELDDLRALIDDTASGIRDVCAELRPALLDYAGLVPALESHIQQFSRRTGLAVRLEHKGLEKRLPADTEALLFRISQEALTNCAKHARARAVDIGVNRRNCRTVLTIADDGIGFDPSLVGSGERDPGLGLLTMRERAEFAGGQLQIESGRGRGTRVTVEI